MFLLAGPAMEYEWKLKHVSGHGNQHVAVEANFSCDYRSFSYHEALEGFEALGVQYEGTCRHSNFEKMSPLMNRSFLHGDV